MSTDPSQLDAYFVDHVTPISAGAFNGWGAAIKAAWQDTLTARAAAVAAAEVATAPTDGQVASLVGASGSSTRGALDSRYGGVLNVRAHGATGDGTTDDTAAVQAALDTAGPGGIVYMPAGTYMLDPVYVPSGCRVYGAGAGTVLKRRPATVTNDDSIGVLNAHGTALVQHLGFELADLTVDGNRANITVDVPGGGDPYDVEGVSLKWARRFRVTGVRVMHVTAEGVDVDDSSDGLIEAVWGEDCGGSAVHLSNGSARVTVRASFAVNCGITLSRGGFDAYGGGATHTLSDLITVGCYRGVTLGAAGTTATGCQDFSPTSGVGLRVTGSGAGFHASRTTGAIEHVGTAGALVGCTAGATLTAADPATAVVGCTPDTPPAAALTYATGWSAGGTVRVERRGQWVTATFRLDKASAATEQETMATLPEGFRPAEATYAGALVFNGSSVYVAGGVQIQTGGQIQARLAGATGVTRVVGQATWRAT